MIILGAAGTTLIKSFESCSLVAYRDQRGVLTIGWGHTGPDVVQGLRWTQEQADTAFLKDSAWACRQIAATVDVGLTQNQIDALASFTFNVGIGAEEHSTLVKLLNRSLYAQAADQFALWNKVDGVPNAGLTRRRAAERALFLTPQSVTI